jgi:transcriptional regulator with XRE-family HTH domain
MTEVIVVTLGIRIRKIRKRQGRTIQELADACGFTRSLLSQIETGKTTPPIATLTRIAHALGVPVSALLGETMQATTVHTPRKVMDQADFILTDKGYSFFAIAAERSEKMMQPLLFEAKRGEVVPKSLSHSGEEFIYVLQGEMRYRVGSVEYLLKTGDSLYFDSEEEHDLEPVSDSVRYLAVFCGSTSA